MQEADALAQSEKTDVYGLGGSFVGFGLGVFAAWMLGSPAWLTILAGYAASVLAGKFSKLGQGR